MNMYVYMYIVIIILALTECLAHTNDTIVPTSIHTRTCIQPETKCTSSQINKPKYEKQFTKWKCFTSKLYSSHFIMTASDRWTY